MFLSKLYGHYIVYHYSGVVGRPAGDEIASVIIRARVMSEVGDCVREDVVLAGETRYIAVIDIRSSFLLLLAYQRIRGFAFMRYINPRFTLTLTLTFSAHRRSARCPIKRDDN